MHLIRKGINFFNSKTQNPKVQSINQLSSNCQCFQLNLFCVTVNVLYKPHDKTISVAEYRGYLAAPEVDLFGRLHPDVETTFFDSVCGLPLFIAPRGRTFEEFKDESLHHGWPSFRPEEIVSENVIIHTDGRMESKCLTHLGHNLPEGGVDRYCIDLVCMAGMPLEGGSPVNIAQTLSLNDENIITAEGLDPDTYESSAEQWSGKNNYARKRIIIGVGVAIAFVSAVGIFHCAKRACRRMSTQTEKNVGTFDEEQSSGSTETY